MASLLLLLVAPILWPLIAKLLWKNEITLRELGINIAIGVILASGVWWTGRYAKTYDVEILNGKVFGKFRDEVSCDHSYSCNCRRDGNGHESCDTCYEHSYDYDWVLNTTVGKLKIDRVDRQGKDVPPRFSLAKIGDPVAKENSFTNYIKAVPQSLFHDKGEVSTSLTIPDYPNNVFDYHYVNRAISVGVPGLALNDWNRDIALALREIGPSKQVNFVLVFANTADPQYAAALERAWLGGKKNDVIVVFGVTPPNEIAWVRILSWTDRQDFKVALRDRIADLKVLDREAILRILVEETQSKFVRKKWQDFAYLDSEIEPESWVLWSAFVLSLLSSIAASVYFSRNREREAPAFGKKFSF